MHPRGANSNDNAFSKKTSEELNKIYELDLQEIMEYSKQEYDKTEEDIMLQQIIINKNNEELNRNPKLKETFRKSQEESDIEKNKNKVNENSTEECIKLLKSELHSTEDDDIKRDIKDILKTYEKYTQQSQFRYEYDHLFYNTDED